jgi:hypothetical protein
VVKLRDCRRPLHSVLTFRLEVEPVITRVSRPRKDFFRFCHIPTLMHHTHACSTVFIIGMARQTNIHVKHRCVKGSGNVQLDARERDDPLATRRVANVSPARVANAVPTWERVRQYCLAEEGSGTHICSRWAYTSFGLLFLNSAHPGRAQPQSFPSGSIPRTRWSASASFARRSQSCDRRKISVTTGANC